ncbi:hypothetical protein G7Y89_g11129 [Cudoniella acicularis]|uniref:Uncharacterized protein n=1 Tax=Cudoniella acicularis TaxID=354080 RepID=A0A8H4W0E2_9HELO|nr:hypothetical protein G7Y89_g11129 [Cudoniella acicularis]
MSFTLTELETAASDVIQILKTVPEFASARVAVIGGLALWKYMPRGRTTEDVDLIINLDNAPNGVKNILLSLYSTVFVQRAQYFFYKSPNGNLIQIDICASWQSPYLPPAAKVVSTIVDGVVPYISPVDLIVFKINSCGLRAENTKRRRDAADAAVLLDEETQSGPLNLTAQQKSTVEMGLIDVVNVSGKSENWWKQRLGL